jgi:hypothetical protein
MEKALMNSLEVGRGYYKRILDEMLSFGNDLSRLITYQGLTVISPDGGTGKTHNRKRAEHRLAAIKVLSQNIQSRASQRMSLDLSPFRTGADILRKELREGDPTIMRSSLHLMANS